MKMYFKKTIGKTVYTFVADGENLYDMITESKKLSFSDVYKCGKCGADSLELNAHLAQGKYKYAHIDCKKCGAQLIFGQREDNPNIFFMRRDKDKKYDWQEWQRLDTRQAPPPPNNYQEEYPGGGY